MYFSVSLSIYINMFLNIDTIYIYLYIYACLGSVAGITIVPRAATVQLNSIRHAAHARGMWRAQASRADPSRVLAEFNLIEALN